MSGDSVRTAVFYMKRQPLHDKEAYRLSEDPEMLKAICIVRIVLCRKQSM